MADVWLRRAALAGWCGAGLLGGATATLTALQYDFMIGLGWRPLAAPTFDWPSGLALGPHGAWMTAAFLGAGALLGGLALGLGRALGPGLGPPLLFAAGAALMLLAAPADPTIRTTPATLPGRIHDAAFALLGLSFLPALLFLAARLRADGRWRDLAGPTLLVALLAAPAFLLKGLFFYAFFAGALAWVAAVSARLWRLGG